MRAKILHESSCRMRVHIMQKRMHMEEADRLAFYMDSQEFIIKTTVHESTANMIVYYKDGYRKETLKAIACFGYEDKKLIESMPQVSSRALNREYQEKLVLSVLSGVVRALFLPTPLRIGWTIYNSSKYILKGLKSLSKRKMDVSVLDAVSISVSVFRKDYGVASSVMLLLGVGELLEEWTYRKSVDDLARMLSLNIDKVWLITDEDEILVPVAQVKKGDKIKVHAGNMIPLDGKILSGEAMINQSSLTGESVPVERREGAFAYAGTVIEEGELVIGVQGISGQGRYDKIVAMIEESEKLKSDTESEASKFADRMVPYTLAGSLLTYLLTKNTVKALSVLMVDYSCALKLCMPIAVLSAMREAGMYNITVKGGKFLEAIAKADIIVFDKTGTLTHATPTVVDVLVCEGRKEDEMIKIAACLEEHYPHSMAKAVVDLAEKRGIEHKEMHSKVEYIVAHGIASLVDGEKVIIGSRHFVFEDENVEITREDEELLRGLQAHHSHLYMAINQKLAAVICIFDPLREEAPDVVARLKELGIKTVMMTGDNQETAAAIVQKVGIEEYYSEVLPEDKANYIISEKEKGNTVIMIGDGINDSPALSAADCGIAIRSGAAIAREIADITISAEELYELLVLKRLSDALMKRIQNNYRFVIGFNSALILLGVIGVFPPTVSALLHNLSTIGISVKSMSDLNPH